MDSFYCFHATFFNFLSVIPRIQLGSDEMIELVCY